MRIYCKDQRKRFLHQKINNRISTISLILFSLFCDLSVLANDGGIEKAPIFARLSGIAPVSNYSQPLVLNGTAAVSYISEGEQSNKIKNIITLSLIEETQKYIPVSFTATVKVRIEYGHSSAYGNQTEQYLTVDYNKNSGAKYNAKKYFSFEGAEYVRVTVIEEPQITPSGTVNFDLREVLLLENEMRVTQYFELSNNVTPANFSGPASISDPADEVTVSWLWAAGAGNNHTQLEWAWLEDEIASAYYIPNTTTVDENLLFKNNSTRIDLPLSFTSYSIPLFYDGAGKLYYRIRPVNIKANGNRSDGQWTTARTCSYTGHSPDLNWQVATTFAEEGKRKSVIEYFDGSLRSRQTVTKDNVTQTTITAETFYDGQGRPAIQILPTPGMSNIIQYQKNLNLFNNQLPDEDPAKYFDLVAVGPPNHSTPPLSNQSGTSEYYSASNPEISQNTNKYIPDAEGYPYTVTRYTPDATGRVMSQSGVGPTHKMGSGHETKYFYGSPSQVELDGLFGTEVGNYTHYFKNMVTDANGQMSISYIDMHGRTIATALAGESPANLDALATSNALMYPNQNGSTIIRNLLDHNTNVIKENSLESVNSLMVPVTTTYNFSYSLAPDKLQIASCTQGVQLCYDCLYDLEISITDESGDTDPVIWKFTNVSVNPDDDCNTATPAFTWVSGTPYTINGNIISFSRQLQPGSYSIRKTLTISESSIQKYLARVDTIAVCKTRQQLIDSVTAVLQAQTDCGNTNGNTISAACTACTENLGTESAYRTNYLNSVGLDPQQTQSPDLETQIHVAYQNENANCQLLCNTTTTNSLGTIRQEMLEDMKPFSGQYALETVPDVTPERPSLNMYWKYDAFADFYSGQPFYKHPKNNAGQTDFYKDALGVKDQTIHFLIPPSTDEYAVLNNTDRYGFQDLFKDSWAEALLPYHPEYNKLVFAETNLVATYNWIDVFSATPSYAQAVTNNYVLTDGNSTAAPYNDAFYSLSGAGSYRTAMINKVTNQYIQLDNNSNHWASMWQMARASVKCNNISDGVQQRDCIIGTVYNVVPKLPPYDDIVTTDEKDRMWNVFKGFYMNERRKDVNQYIKVNTPAVENDLLIAEKYVLHFHETDQQIANQGNQTGNGQNTPWTWWPSTPNNPPVGINLDPNTVNANNYTTRCDGYIDMWKAQLLQCPQIEALAPATRDALLATITNGMKQVCINGSDAANPYGSSNVRPGVTTGPLSFEEVINSAFTTYGINKTDLCNPFMIEWPKPYGKGPRLFQDLTNVVDSCACVKFSEIKAQAAAANYDPNQFAQLNEFLQWKYQDELTPELFAALQNCSSYTHQVCDKQETLVNANCYDPDPCYNVAAFGLNKKNADSKTGTTTSSNFAPSCNQYQQVIAYFFDLNGPTPSGTCQTDFANYFNSWYNLGWTYQQIADSYLATCGQPLNVCTNCITQVSCYDDVNCRTQFVPYQLPSPQPFPEFLKCGSVNTRCFSCANLSTLTSEFKSQFNNTPYNVAPVFNSNNPTDDEIASNILYARFLNYRTGLQYDWATYADAAANAGPACDLANYSNNSNANQNVICGDPKPLNDTTGIIFHENPCQHVFEQAEAIADAIWIERKKSLIKDFESSYRAKCFAIENTESFSVTYTNKEYHYTLYYYDMANNLVKTVPPKGVRPDFSPSYISQVATDRANGVLNARPHEFVTQYRFNSLGKVVAQNSPDANTSKFWYDVLGRSVVSQNAQQQVDNKYSYTVYDPFGRSIEVGQKPHTTAMTQTISQDPVALNDWIVTNGGTREQITFTVYDQPYGPGLDPLLTQQNLRNRVSFTGTKNLITDAMHYAATFYTYDVHGNVDFLLQDYKGVTEMDATSNRFKLLAYDYDLISGKVKMVSYQPDKPDAFYHRYKYDVDNKLLSVETSRDKILWERDAAYSYYKYGPLARTEYGQLRVQGIDYAYTIQGWLKGVNSTAISTAGTCPAGSAAGSALIITDRGQYEQPTVYRAQQSIDFDPGFESIADDVFETDINSNSTVCNPNEVTTSYVQGDIGRDGDANYIANAPVARDAFGFALNYFINDYKPVDNSVMPFANGMHNLPQTLINNIADGVNTGAELFNGNVASMMVNIPKLGTINSGTGMAQIVYGYRYDQLSRIVGMNAYSGFNNSNNTFTPTAINDYRERVSYDPNGNILSYSRNGNANTGGLAMDALRYMYYYKDINGATHQYDPTLLPVPSDAKSFTNQLAAVKDDVGNANAYATDIDNQNDENYTVDKIGNLTSDAAEGVSIQWTFYGKIKNITKTNGTVINYSYDATGNRITKTVNAGNGPAMTTIYVRDANGNVMSIYEKQTSEAIAQTETHLYGSSRIGMINKLTILPVDAQLAGNFGTARLSTFTRNEKVFELSNHLGNMLATINDKKIQIDADGNGLVNYYMAEVITAQDYYPFGMLQSGRQYAVGVNYRYGFNGKEKDKESHSSSIYDYGFRIYNPAVARFLSVDPLFKSFAMLSPYQFSSNSPISSIDLDGLESKIAVTCEKGVKNISDIQEINSAQKVARTNVVKYIQSNLLLPEPGCGTFLTNSTGYLSADERNTIIMNTIDLYLGNFKTTTASSPPLVNSDKGPGTATFYYDFNYWALIPEDASYKETLSNLQSTINSSFTVYETADFMFKDRYKPFSNKINDLRIKGGFKLAQNVLAYSSGEYDEFLRDQVGDLAKDGVSLLLEKAVENGWLEGVFAVSSKFAGKAFGMTLGFLLSSSGEAHDGPPLCFSDECMKAKGRKELVEQTIASMLLFFMRANQPTIIEPIQHPTSELPMLRSWEHDY